MIIVKNLNKKFNNNFVLENISFKINTGEFAIIYGLNGAGKTTLIKCLVGLLNMQKGEVVFKPENKSEISLYLGHEMLIEKLKVKEYLFLAGELKGVPKHIIDEKILFYAEKFRFKSFLNQFISEISLGTKSKILFVSCLLNSPKVLIMDEPFIGLDLVSIKEMVDVLFLLKKEGCTIFISSHQVDVIEPIVDKVLIIKNHNILLDSYLVALKKTDSYKAYLNLSDFIISKIEM